MEYRILIIENRIAQKLELGMFQLQNSVLFHNPKSKFRIQRLKGVIYE